MPSKPLNNEMLDDKTATAFEEEDVETIRLYYPSNLMGRPIRNAVTGARYPWRVGSKESKLLFRVIDSTSNCDKNGYVITNANVKDLNSTAPADAKKMVYSRDPNHCYYESPHQYMQHHNISLNSNLILDWKNKTDMLHAALNPN